MLVALDVADLQDDECRADPWFQSRPEVVDRLESVLTKFYFAGEGPEWQAIWDQVTRSSEGELLHLSTGVRPSPWYSRASTYSQLLWQNRHAASPRLGEPTRSQAAMSSGTQTAGRSRTRDSIQEAAHREGAAELHPSIGLTQVTAAFCNSSALKLMAWWPQSFVPRSLVRFLS
jgi:hypothetical protein